MCSTLHDFLIIRFQFLRGEHLYGNLPKKSNGRARVLAGMRADTARRIFLGRLYFFEIALHKLYKSRSRETFLRSYNFYGNLVVALITCTNSSRRMQILHVMFR